MSFEDDKALGSKQDRITSLEKQLAECRAAIKVKDTALANVIVADRYCAEPNVSDEHRQAKSDAHHEAIISVEEALTIKPGDVELVEFGELRNGLWVSGAFSADMSFKLYHIKTKEQTCTS